MRPNEAMMRLRAVLGVVFLAVTLAGTGQAVAADRAAVTQVRVTFTNATIGLSQSGVQAGAVTFVAVNHGRAPHVLAISGPGLRGVRTRKIGVGRSATLTVTLGTGAYMLADPLGSVYSVRWIEVSPAANVVSSGNSNVVTPITVTTGMNCD